MISMQLTSNSIAHQILLRLLSKQSHCVSYSILHNFQCFRWTIIILLNKSNLKLRNCRFKEWLNENKYWKFTKNVRLRKLIYVKVKKKEILIASNTYTVGRNTRYYFFLLRIPCFYFFFVLQRNDFPQITTVQNHQIILDVHRCRKKELQQHQVKSHQNNVWIKATW